MSLLPQAEQYIMLTTFVNICIHLQDFVYPHLIVLNSHIMLLLEKSKTRHICMILWQWPHLKNFDICSCAFSKNN